MRTEKQIEASRLNGAKSRGPSSVEGKARSSRNGLKSGLYALNIVNTAEDKEAFERLQAEYIERFQPMDVEERLCLDIIIRSEWEWRRLVDAETKLWDHEMSQPYKTMDTGPAGAFQRSQTSLLRASRMIDSARRTVFLTIDRLKALQAARQAAEADIQTVEPEPTFPGLGFVPSRALTGSEPEPAQPSTPNPQPPIPDPQPPGFVSSLCAAPSGAEPNLNLKSTPCTPDPAFKSSVLL